MFNEKTETTIIPKSVVIDTALIKAEYLATKAPRLSVFVGELSAKYPEKKGDFNSQEGFNTIKAVVEESEQELRAAYKEKCAGKIETEALKVYETKIPVKLHELGPAPVLEAPIKEVEIK